LGFILRILEEEVKRVVTMSFDEPGNRGGELETVSGIRVLKGTVKLLQVVNVSG
jgi:hypothetical protein